MARFKSTSQGRPFAPKFKNKILAACIARDSSVENEALLDINVEVTFIIQLKSFSLPCTPRYFSKTRFSKYSL
jgi:hypothetical protein